jgi:outer membrane biosynthesis protein TonB
MWAVLYDDGTSLTTVSEPIARSLAEAERERGHRVTIRRLDDDADGAPEPEPEPNRPTERFARPEPISEPEPAPAPELTNAPEPAPAPEPARTVEPTLAPEPARTVEPARTAEPAPVPKPAREPEPAARVARPARGRRLLLYALAAISIVVAAALVDHWNALPRVGATTSSSPAQVSGPPHRPQLLPPLNQPPVMHFSNAVRARSAPGPQSATGERSSGRQSATARGG